MDFQSSTIDEVVKSRKSLRVVIPVPIFIGINSSRNPVIPDSYKRTIDEVVKSRKSLRVVIPAKAGIQ